MRGQAAQQLPPARTTLRGMGFLEGVAAGVSSEVSGVASCCCRHCTLLDSFLQRSRRACQRETRPQRKGDHGATLSSGGGEAAEGVKPLCLPLTRPISLLTNAPSLRCPGDSCCQATLMEHTAVLLFLLLLLLCFISCCRTPHSSLG